MSEYAGRPNLPGYVSIKEAAKLLGISDKRVYEYVEEGRLPSMWVADVIVLPLDEVKSFKRRSSGRPRKSVPQWHISSDDNAQFTTSIVVSVRPDQQKALLQRLESIREQGYHLFPGTVARFILESEPGQVEVLLIWRSTVTPEMKEREQALEAFRQTLHDVLDWDTATYKNGKVLMHT